MKSPATVPCTYELARREFPAYADEMFPASIPAGFEDSSWHNDLSPSVSADFGGIRVRIWFETEAPESRGWEGAGRYIVTFENMAAGVDCETMLETEEWAEVLALLDVTDFAAAIARPITTHGGHFLFCRALAWHDAGFHFEDSPDSILWDQGGPVTPDHYAALSARVAEAIALPGWTRDYCPISAFMEVEGRDMSAAPTRIGVAELETPNFTFRAYGATGEAARVTLLEGLKKHAAERGLPESWPDEYIQCAVSLELNPGVTYRDYSPL